MDEASERARWRTRCERAFDALYERWSGSDAPPPRTELLALLEAMMVRLHRIETGDFPPTERPTEPARKIDSRTFTAIAEGPSLSEKTSAILEEGREAAGLTKK